MAKRNRAPAKGAPSLPLAAPVALLALLMSPHCRADWKITPGLELRETYTDNVRLEPSATAQGSFITELAPSVSVAAEGPRLKLRAALIGRLYAYSNNQVEGGRSQRELTADARAKLIDDLLYFDSAASIRQESISAFGPRVTNRNGYADANSNEVRTYRISPYLVHRFGAAASTELRYTRDSVQSGGAGLANSTADSLAMSVASGPSFRTLGWGLQYNRQDLDDSLAGKSLSENSSLSLRLRVTSGFSLNANGGYDKYDYDALGGTTAGRSHSLGFSWTPSLRTSLQASAGKRYFGSSYYLNAMHRSRHTVWSINYDDAVTTSRAQFLLPATVDTAALLDRLFTASIPDRIARQQAVEAYLRATGLPATLADTVNYFSNRFLLQKQLQASAAFNTARTTTIASLSGIKRTALSTGQSDSALLGSQISTLNDDIRQVGATLAVNYRLSPRTGLNLLVSKNRVESLSTGIKDNQQLLSLSMTSQLRRKLSGAVELRRSQGNALTLGGRSYRENAISASLSLKL